MIITAGKSDTEQFENAIVLARQDTGSGGGIGTLSEKTLHKTLKRYISPYADEHEIKIGKFVADIVNEDGITEIQTGGFDKLREKLEAFLSVSAVTVVHPIVHTNRIIWVDPKSGEEEKPRKSPFTGSIYGAFDELYKIKSFLTHPKLTLRFLLVDTDEYRYLNSRRGKRYKTRRIDRIPTALVAELTLKSAHDYCDFLPDTLPEQFTSADLKKHAGIPLSAAQSVLNILSYVSAVQRCGDSGRYYLYEVTNFEC